MPPDDDTMWQLNRLAPFAIAWRMAGNFPPMVAALQDMRKKTRLMQNHYLEAQSLWGLIIALIGTGQLSQAHERGLELHQVVDHLGKPLPLAAYPDLFRAQLSYAWNQLEVARSEALIAIEKTAPLQYLDILMVAYEVLIRTCIAQNDLTEAERALHAMEQVHKSAGISLFRPWIESLQVHLWLAQGNLLAAVDWAEHTSYRHEVLVYSREIASLALARVLLADRRYPQALQLLAALLSSAEQVARVGSMIAILSLQVAALQASGTTQEALRVLDRLLTQASAEGYLRVFLDAGEPMRAALVAWLKSSQRTASPALVSYTQTVLTAFASEQRQVLQQEAILPVSQILPAASSDSRAPTQAAQQLLEPLTPRELEVLHCLSEGATNQEIANQLVVSLATVKKHVANILSKLGAENRTQAIARARTLSLL